MKTVRHSDVRWILVDGLDAIDARPLGPMRQPGSEPIHGIGGSKRQHFDTTIVQVDCRSGDSETERLFLRATAKKHALHAPGNEKPLANDRVVHAIRSARAAGGRILGVTARQ